MVGLYYIGHRQSIHIYPRSNPDTFQPDPIWNDEACRLLKRTEPRGRHNNNKKKKNNNNNE